MLMQMGTADPMELPVSGDQQHFSKPNPKMLVKEESVTVKGGTFKAKHYRDKTPNGDTIDYWISEKVFPLGLVKMESEQKTNPNIKGPIKIELAAVGKGPSSHHQAGEADGSGADAADDGRRGTRARPRPPPAK